MRERCKWARWLEAQHTSKGIPAFQEDTGVKTALGTAYTEALGDAKGKALRRAQPRQQAVGGRWVAIERQADGKDCANNSLGLWGWNLRDKLKITNHEKRSGLRNFSHLPCVGPCASRGKVLSLQWVSSTGDWKCVSSLLGNLRMWHWEGESLGAGWLWRWDNPKKN